jgi:hypothetical protein
MNSRPSKQNCVVEWDFAAGDDPGGAMQWMKGSVPWQTTEKM